MDKADLFSRLAEQRAAVLDEQKAALRDVARQADDAHVALRAAEAAGVTDADLAELQRRVDDVDRSLTEQLAALTARLDESRQPRAWLFSVTRDRMGMIDAVVATPQST